MLLNVVTTNPGEVFELLGNLAIAIATVVILYVPIIIYAIILIRKKKYIKQSYICTYRKFSTIAVIAGLISLSGCYISGKNYSISEGLFPINVCDNMVTAVKRTIKTNNYTTTSKGFSYNATATHPDSHKEIYVMVIGETGRADNWQLFGYNRPTNPTLSKQDGVIGFGKVLTESNTTHKSVPMLLSSITAMNFDSIYYHKSIITAFNEAGFHTSFFSNQKRNRSFIDYFGSEADNVEYLSDSGSNTFDAQLVKRMNRLLAEDKFHKQFIVLHTYGSHFNYKERYPEKMKIFHPDNVVDASASYRNELINAYDNSIAYTDRLLSDIINSLQKHTDANIAMLYVSDHGEDIFDDSRNRFLHASPIPTYYQLHVPLITWLSKSYQNNHPGIQDALYFNSKKNVSSSSSVFHTMLQLAGINSAIFNRHLSLADTTYIEPERLYLNDRNKALPIGDSGMNQSDYELLKTNKLYNINHR